MNDLITLLYERWFDYNDYSNLLGIVYDSKDFGILGWGLILLALIALLVFYKFWDPIEGQRFKWIISLFINTVFSFGFCYLLLYNNQGLIEAITNHEEGLGVNPEYFILRMAAISALYALVLAIVFCIFPLPIRYFSTNNNKLKIV